jgi:hypothetical protein
VLCGGHEQIGAILCLEPGIGPGGNKQLHDGELIGPGRNVKGSDLSRQRSKASGRRSASPRNLGVDRVCIGALGEQFPDEIGIANLRRRVKHGVAPSICRFGISARVDENLSTRAAIGGGKNDDRRPSESWCIRAGSQRFADSRS